VTAPLLLASRSPQRRAILEQLGLPFRVLEPAYHEVPLTLPPEDVVRAYAEGKARSVERRAGDGPVLGVDTDVVLDGDLLGKPADAAAATAMLRRLAGRDHVVLSGLSLLDEQGQHTDLAATTVRFRPLDEREIADYVAMGEWRGRAGAYAIQGRGAALVERIDGCFYNVVGLPVALLVRLLRERQSGPAGAPAGE
jgi:septum formation protein